MPLDELRAACADLLTDADVVRTYHRDEADLCAAGTPLAVARPRTTDEVAALVRTAARHRIPVVPQGARTGLAGGANASDGALVISLAAMTRILDFDPDNRVATVQAGVVNAELRRTAAEHGLAYPPDP